MDVHAESVDGEEWKWWEQDSCAHTNPWPKKRAARHVEEGKREPGVPSPGKEKGIEEGNMK